MDIGGEQKELAWDLRVTYTQVVGTISIKIAEARENRDFQRWFNLLEDLHTEINQKLTEKERKEFEEKILNDCLNILGKNYEAFMRKSQDPKEVTTVYRSIKKVEMWLKQKMDGHNLYGSKDRDEGL